YGHALKTAGRQEEGIAAYRRSIALAPHSGIAYWSLANLKTFRFTAEDVEAMRAQLRSGKLTSDEREQMHFALGKALEDAKDYPDLFSPRARGQCSARGRLPLGGGAPGGAGGAFARVSPPGFLRGPPRLGGGRP